MSKFFKALEKAEHERENGTAPLAIDGPPVEAMAVDAVVVEPVAERPPTPFVAPPPPAPPAPVAPRPVYGAPVARQAAGRGFAWQMDDDVTTDGEIDDHLVSLLAPTSYAAEQYRAVRLALETLHRERGTRVVAIASPGRGEGRTMTAINLAGALGQAPDARVILVEADLRHPAIARYLGVAAGRGLSGYLLDSATSVDAVLQAPRSIAFTVLPAGPASSMPYELLKSPRLAGLLAELRQRFDYVLMDTPSALPFPDVGILRDLVDGFVGVVRANHTPRERLFDMMTMLGRQRALGLVFNDDAQTGVTTFESVEAGWRRLVPRPPGATRG